MNNFPFSGARRARATAMFWLLLGALSLVGPARAVEMADVYTAEVAWDASARDGRELAYAAALGDVLRRITPDASRADAALLFDKPADYVLGWREGAAGRLWVSFDGVALADELRNAGIPVWGSDRPLTLVWLAIETVDGERRILSRQAAQQRAPLPVRVTPPLVDPAETGEPAAAPTFDFNAALELAAKARGIPLLLPLYDERDQAAVTDSDVWGGFDEVLLAASRRYGVDSVLVGRASERQPERIRWTWLFAGDSTNFNGPAATAVERVSQSLIAQFASSPEASIGVRVSIVGVTGMTGYGRVLRYLRAQSLIEDVRVLAMRSDQLLLEIDALVSRVRIAQMLDGGVLVLVDEPLRGARLGNYLPSPLPSGRVTTQPGMSPETPASGETKATDVTDVMRRPPPALTAAPSFADADLYFRLREAEVSR